jgi:hypothetical protein
MAFQGVNITIKQLPEILLKKTKYIEKLWSKGDYHKIRLLRDSSKSIEILIYHHSAGTDSYFHDTEARYYSWEDIQVMSENKLENGENFMVVVMPYKSGVHFTKGSLAPHFTSN